MKCLQNNLSGLNIELYWGTGLLNSGTLIVFLTGNFPDGSLKNEPF